MQDIMAKLIDEYFSKHLELDWDAAVKLHSEYYTSYGLAIEGLVRHHQIDPLDYNAEVDDALPLEGIIKPNPELRQLLEDVDKSKVTMWLFTNAYVTHGKRVVGLLGIDDLFDGMTFCDYGQQPLICKPHPQMFKKAMREASVDKVEDCFFVGRFRRGVPPILVSSTNCCQMTRSSTARKRKSLGGLSRISSRKVSRTPRPKHPNSKSSIYEN